MLSYRFYTGPNITIPIFSHNSVDGNVSELGTPEIGVTLYGLVIKPLDPFSIGLKLRINNFGYSLENEFQFPEDAIVGTTSSIEASNRITSFGLGIHFGYYMFNSDWYLSAGPEVEFELFNKTFQQLHYGFAPDVINIKDSKVNVYESGVNTIISFEIGKGNISNSKLGFVTGIQYNLNSYKYYTFGWEVKPLKMSLGITFTME